MKGPGPGCSFRRRKASCDHPISKRIRGVMMQGPTMPGLNMLSKVIAKPVPRLFSPRVHAVADSMRIGAYLASAGWLWKRSKRAATAALLCATAETLVSLLTDYDGRTRNQISFRAHRNLEIGLASMAAAMPEFFSFEDDPLARKFSLIQGALSTAVLELTRFPGRTENAKVRHSRVA
jgi:hypothetical protein